MNIKVGGKSFEAGRVFCIGRNYAAHAKELKNDIPAEPVIFCKPPTSLVSHLQNEIPFPAFGRELHHEVEVVVLVGKAGKPESEADAPGSDFLTRPLSLFGYVEKERHRLFPRIRKSDVKD